MFQWFRKPKQNINKDTTTLTGELLQFLSDFLARAGPQRFPPVAYVIGLPIKEAVSGQVIETSLSGGFDSRTNTVFWKRYIYDAEEAMEEEGKPSVYVDRGSTTDTNTGTKFDHARWNAIVSDIAKTLPLDAKIC